MRSARRKRIKQFSYPLPLSHSTCRSWAPSREPSNEKSSRSCQLWFISSWRGGDFEGPCSRSNFSSQSTVCVAVKACQTLRLYPSYQRRRAVWAWCKQRCCVHGWEKVFGCGPVWLWLCVRALADRDWVLRADRSNSCLIVSVCAEYRRGIWLWKALKLSWRESCKEHKIHVYLCLWLRVFLLDPESQHE